MRRKRIDAPNVQEITFILSQRYHDWEHYNYKNPLKELLFILCSVQTNEERYRYTHAALRRSYPTFKDLADAPETEIADVIQDGGLAIQKAHKIKQILSELIIRFGKPTLAPLKRMSDKEREKFLTSLMGVGKKTARCVMMYSLGSQVFPVDLHCWRVCRRLGWIRPTRANKSCSPNDMDRLQSKIPSDLRYRLHVNMISFGREICTTRNPKCLICPIQQYCRRIGVRDSR